VVCTQHQTGASVATTRVNGVLAMRNYSPYRTSFHFVICVSFQPRHRHVVVHVASNDTHSSVQFFSQIFISGCITLPPPYIFSLALSRSRAPFNQISAPKASSSRVAVDFREITISSVLLKICTSDDLDSFARARQLSSALKG